MILLLGIGDKSFIKQGFTKEVLMYTFKYLSVSSEIEFDLRH